MKEQRGGHSKPHAHHDRTRAMLLILTCTAFTSSGQVLLKIASSSIELDLISLATNIWLILGLASYALGAVLMIAALRIGDLSFVYPLISLSFIWVTLLSYVILHESLTPAKGGGMAFILIGISLIGMKGDKRGKRR